QHAHGTWYDDRPGDPFMSLIPAADQFGGRYIMRTPSEYERLIDSFMNWYVYGSFVNLVLPAAATNDIIVDGVPLGNLPTTPVPIGNSGFVGVQMPVADGMHSYSSATPFGALLYGWGAYISYAFAGGLQSDTLEQGTTLQLTQPTTAARVGEEKVAFARALNTRGEPLSDLLVTFTVAGANRASNQVMIDPFGTVTFSYRGTNAGQDTITATLLNLQQQVISTWNTGSGNQSPLVNAGTNQAILF